MGRLYETYIDAIAQAIPQGRLYEVYVDVIVDDGSSSPSGAGGLQGRDLQGTQHLQGLRFALGTAVQGALRD